MTAPASIGLILAGETRDLGFARMLMSLIAEHLPPASPSVIGNWRPVRTRFSAEALASHWKDSVLWDGREDGFGGTVALPPVDEHVRRVSHVWLTAPADRLPRDAVHGLLTRLARSVDVEFAYAHAATERELRRGTAGVIAAAPPAVVLAAADVEHGVPDVYWAMLLGPRLRRNVPAVAVAASGAEIAEDLDTGGVYIQVTDELRDVEMTFDVFERRRAAVAEVLAAYAVIGGCDFTARDPGGAADLAALRRDTPGRVDMEDALAELMRARADEFVSGAGEVGVALGFQIDSLRALEGALPTLIPREVSRDPDLREALVEALGAYVGETIVQSLDGAWIFDEEFDTPAVELDGVRFFPLAKVEKRLTRGMAEALDVYAEEVRALLSREVS